MEAKGTPTIATIVDKDKLTEQPYFTKAEEAVKSAYSSCQTRAQTSASKKDQKGTLVIDLIGNHPQEASDLARLLGGRADSLPKGKTRPDADILIISGKYSLC